LFFNASIGIDLSPHGIRVVVLKGSFKGVQATARKDFHVGPGKLPSDAAAEMAAFIAGFVREHGIGAAPMYAAIPGENCIMREITFPRAVRENLRGTLRYEMEKYVPFSVDDVCFDSAVISEDRDAEKINVLLAVLKKTELDSWMQLSDRLEAAFSGITIAAAGVVHYFQHQYPDAGGPVIILHLRDDRFDLIHIRDHALVYARTVRIPDPGTDIFPLAATQLEQAGRTFGTEAQQIRFKVFGKTETAALETHLADLSRFKLIGSPPRDPDLPGGDAVTAVGVALKGMQKAPAWLEFMPSDRRRKPDRRGVILMLLLCAVLVLSGVAWAGNHYLGRRAALDRLDREIARVQSAAEVVRKKEAEIERTSANLDFLSGLRPGNRFVLDVMRELTETIPESAWLREFRLSGDAVTLTGQADSASALIPLLEESPLFTDVKFLTTIRKDRDGKEVFRIGLTLKKK
jgi:Tfp pilus assembly protein PilN